MSNYRENGWSPIIYGRTHEVDFRLLTIPEYFNKEDSNWAMKYILETTQMPEKLTELPRWSLVSDRDYYLFGVTCDVRQLLSDRESQRLIFDYKDRPVHAFIGYIAQKDSQNSAPNLPKYEDLNLKIFQAGYVEYVERCWDVKNYQIESKQPLLSISVTLDFLTSLTAEFIPIVLNTDRDKIGIWSSDRDVDLWNSIVRSIESNPDLPLSVSLNIPKIQNLESTDFLNVSNSQWEPERNGELILKSALKSKSRSERPAIADRILEADRRNEEDLTSKSSPDRATWTMVDILREIQCRRPELPHLDRKLQQAIWFYWFNQKNKLQDFSTRLSNFNLLEIADFVAEEIEQLFDNFNPTDSLQSIAFVLHTEVRTLRIAIEDGVRNKTKTEIENLFDPRDALDLDRPKVNPAIGFKPSRDLPSSPDERTKEDWF